MPNRGPSIRLTRRRLQRIPLVPAAGCLMAGIALGRYCPPVPGVWAVLAVASAIVAAAALASRRLAAVAVTSLAIAIVTTGAWWSQWRYHTLPEHHLVTAVGGGSMPATIRGHVTAPPVVARRTGRPYQTGPRTIVLVDTTGVASGPPGQRTWQAATGLVRVIVDGQADVAVGQHVELVGELGRYVGPDNPGQFDREARARREGVWLWMTVPDGRGVRTIGGDDSPRWYSAALWRIRSAARARLTAPGEDMSAQLVEAMVVGRRGAGLHRLSRAMARSGTAHLLSISGLHLGIFLSFVFFLCRVAMLNVRRAAVVVLVVLGMYLLLAEPRAPLLRSAVMAAAMCVALIVGRPYSALNALAAAAIVLLGADPMQLFDAGFQLSFAIVTGLLVWHPRVKQTLFGNVLRRRGLTVLRHAPWRRALRTISDWAMTIVSAAATAYAVAAPLVAYHFGLFSPYAPLLSVLLLPLVVGVLVPGYLAMAVGPLADGLSWQLSRVSGAVADVLIDAVALAERLPGLCVDLRPVNAGWVILCYAVPAAVAFRRRLPGRWAWPAVAAVLLAAATVWTQSPAPAPPQAELHVLDVGSGQCIVLRMPDGCTVLLDAGSIGPQRVWPEILQPFLRSGKLPVPEAAMISHANVDHYSGVLEMLRAHQPLTVYTNDYFGHDVRNRPAEATEAELLDILRRRGESFRRLGASDVVRLSPRVTVDVLWPPRDTPDLGDNDTSLVLRVNCGRRRVLVCGDIEQTAQRSLLSAGTDLRADVLILPHHGGWSASLPEFVRAVDPPVVVVSGGGLRAGLGSADAGRRAFYEDLVRTRHCRATASSGYIRVTLGDDDPPTVETMHR